MLRLDSLTGLRAILAGLVLIVHSFLRVGWLKDPIVKGTVGSFGHFGVVGFFILSGLILALVYENRTWKIKEFAVNRFARIYPLYLLGIFIALPIDWFSPGFVAGGKVEALALSLGSIQSWFEFSNGRFNGPGWTLSVEFFFYALFPLLFVVNKYSKNLLTLVGCIFLVGTAYYWDENDFYTYYRFPLMRLWEFALGIIAARWICKKNKSMDRPWMPALFLLASGPIVGYFLVQIVDWNFIKWLWMAFASCSAIVLLGVGDFNQVRSRPLSSKLWVLGGEISFGVYILHDAIQRYAKVIYEKVFKISLHDSHVVIKLLYIAITVSVSIIMAYYVYKKIEIPARNYIRKKFAA